jgi:hypothetical protein
MLRDLALALNQLAVYGPIHKVALRATENAYRGFAECLARYGEIVIAWTDGILVVNELQIGVDGPVERVLVPALTKLGLDSFSIWQGLTQEEFVRLVQILAKGNQYKRGEVSGQTFRRALEVSGIEHVGVQHVRYERVREDEAVVHKDVKQAAESQTLDDSPLPADRLALAYQQQSTQRMAELVAEGIEKPEELSEAILAVLERPLTEEQGTAFVTQFAHALEGAFSELPSTPTGLRTVTRHIRALRKSLEEGAKEHPWADGRRLAQMDGMLQDVVNSLKVEVFAVEYGKRKQALEKSERQIAGFVKRQGAGAVDEYGVRERLGESGMSFAEWAAISSRAQPAGETSPGQPAIARLAGVADELRSAVEAPEGGTVEKALEAAREAHGALDKLTEDIAGKIRQFIEAAHEEPPQKGDATKPRRNRRKELLEKLAEIAQELCQPLSVITASVDMIASNHLGEVNESQQAMLELASQGTERMRKLVYALMEIADVPEELHPNQEVIAGFY